MLQQQQTRAPEVTWLHDCLFTLLIKKWTENWLENSLSLEIKKKRLFICMEAGWC